MELQSYKVRAMQPPTPTLPSMKPVRATSEKHTKERLPTNGARLMSLPRVSTSRPSGIHILPIIRFRNGSKRRGRFFIHRVRGYTTRGLGEESPLGVLSRRREP